MGVKAWYKSIMKYKKFKAFTLIEMLVVVAIIGIIASIAVGTSRSLREQAVFSSNYHNIEGLIAEARNRSLTGESYEDTSDYDADGSMTDFILPNSYIINFLTVDGVTTVSLYADLFDSNIGQLDIDDFFLESFELDDSIRLELDSRRSTGGSAIINESDFSILYATPDADFELVNEPNTSLEIKIYQVNNDDEEIRAKYLFMHYLFGIPEVLNESYLNPVLTPPSLK